MPNPINRLISPQVWRCLVHLMGLGQRIWRDSLYHVHCLAGMAGWAVSKWAAGFSLGNPQVKSLASNKVHVDIVYIRKGSAMVCQDPLNVLSLPAAHWICVLQVFSYLSYVSRYMSIYVCIYMCIPIVYHRINR